MDIILKKFFLSRNFGNLIIDNITKNRKITVKYYDFTRINRTDAKITLSLKPNKYKLYLTSNKDIEFEIKRDNKVLLNENKNKVYFTINNNWFAYLSCSLSGVSWHFGYPSDGQAEFCPVSDQSWCKSQEP